jgi:intracellular sulfur oxidation DsrE/DsrF family protein
LLPLSLALAPVAGAVAQTEPATNGEPAREPLRIAYHIGEGVDHIGEGVDQAAAMVQNIRNQLRIAPDIRIAVVAVGPGIDFLIEGAKDRNGNPFDATVEDLAAQGVSFRICETTMNTRGVTKADILPEALVVPSGMNELARLQLQEHYAYIRP